MENSIPGGNGEQCLALLGIIAALLNLKTAAVRCDRLGRVEIAEL